MLPHRPRRRLRPGLLVDITFRQALYTRSRVMDAIRAALPLVYAFTMLAPAGCSSEPQILTTSGHRVEHDAGQEELGDSGVALKPHIGFRPTFGGRDESLKIRVRFRSEVFAGQDAGRPQSLHLHVRAPDDVARLYWSSHERASDSSSLSGFRIMSPSELEFVLRVDSSLPAGQYKFTINTGTEILNESFYFR